MTGARRRRIIFINTLCSLLSWGQYQYACCPELASTRQQLGKCHLTNGEGPSRSLVLLREFLHAGGTRGQAGLGKNGEWPAAHRERIQICHGVRDGLEAGDNDGRMRVA